MRRAGRHDLEVDLWWQQTGTGEWVALVTNRKTGRRVEARSATELREALESLRDGGSQPEYSAPPDTEGADICAES